MSKILEYKKTHQILYLDSSIDNISTIDIKRVSIILSPSMYWIQKLLLPLKYKYQIKKAMPSLFEDIITNQDSISYYSYKDENRDYIIAYDKDKILTYIKALNIKLSSIKGIYFAQSELCNTAPLVDTTDNILLKQDDIVIELPKSVVDTKDTKAIQEIDIALSKNKINLKNLTADKNRYSIDKISVILMLLIAIFGYEYNILNQQLTDLTIKKKEIRKKYKIKDIKIYHKLHKEYKLQKSYREAIAIALSTRLNKDEYIKYISLTKESINLIYILNSRYSIQSIVNRFKRANYKVTIIHKRKDLIIKVKR
jgi:hypothetical protein